jgi:proline dehydrogenase
MIPAVSKTFFDALAGSHALKRLASTYGLRSERSFARRFIAGETVEEAVTAARAIERAGMTQTLDLLGESVANIAEADMATRAYLSRLDAIVAAGIGRNISLKLTQLGLTVDRATSVDNLRRILDVAGRHEFFVRVDMENSPYTQVTIDIFETIWQQG